MILVISGPSAIRPKDLACSLAVELGWRYVDADEFRFLPLAAAPAGVPSHASRPTWLASLHASVAFALERREPLIVICPPLTDAQREILRGELRPVRFVALEERGALDETARRDALVSPTPVDLVVEVDPHVTPERTLGEIRREFGL